MTPLGASVLTEPGPSGGWPTDGNADKRIAHDRCEEDMTQPSSLRPSVLARVALFIASALLDPAALAAQGTSASPLPCDCPGAFQRTVERIETDYVAFPLETRPPRDTSWRAHVAALRPQAAGLDAPSCSWLLRSLVRFFRDGHLLVIDMPAPDTSGLERRRSDRPTLDVGSPASRWHAARVLASLKQLRARGDRLAAVEGVWRGPGYRIAVLRDPDDRDRATGVLLEVDSGRWAAGQVRAEFVQVRGEWRATVWDEAFHPRTSPVDLSRGALLRMAPILWGRVDPAEAEAFVDATDPRRPTVAYPDDSTAVLSVVTFDPAYGRALSTLVDAEWERLRARPHLVIDLRGNEGGSSGEVAPLLPFLWGTADAAALTALGKPADALVRSSPATIAFWERGRWTPAGLLDRLRAAVPGTLVAFDPSARAIVPAAPKRTTRPDQRVDLLVDGATVSAAEQVVLWARSMGRARVVGEPTGGSIDYQSAWLSRVACAAMGPVVSLPLIATSGRLPNGGFNAHGIVPDRRIVTRGAWLRAIREH